jgi:UDPglucose--hexose-1-phosphate uridylyltransferase
MPELRQNFFSKEWVIIAIERAKRPEELIAQRALEAIPSLQDTCAFCSGNEDKKPHGILRFPENANDPWPVRMIPNKFAALSSEL